MLLKTFLASLQDSSISFTLRYNDCIGIICIKTQIFIISQIGCGYGHIIRLEGRPELQNQLEMVLESVLKWY